MSFHWFSVQYFSFSVQLICNSFGQHKIVWFFIACRSLVPFLWLNLQNRLSLVLTLRLLSAFIKGFLCSLFLLWSECFCSSWWVAAPAWDAGHTHKVMINTLTTVWHILLHNKSQLFPPLPWICAALLKFYSIHLNLRRDPVRPLTLNPWHQEQIECLSTSAAFWFMLRFGHLRTSRWPPAAAWWFPALWCPPTSAAAAPRRSPHWRTLPCQPAANPGPWPPSPDWMDYKQAHTGFTVNFLPSKQT